MRLIDDNKGGYILENDCPEGTNKITLVEMTMPDLIESYNLIIEELKEKGWLSK